jgi:hypothetical protein
MLELMAGGIIFPRTVPGLTVTTSSPFSSANFHAAFSASVFETEYQSYTQKAKSDMSRAANY